ncbi:MAG: DUF3467 domain-containing protein [Anaerolineae bacterium]|jgi:hypothetical protein|nr:DUF3467 domain-containing protein [Anaerolineae bacterium]
MPEPKKKPQPRRLNLEIPADLPATYANFAIITHSPWEVFLDFAQILPNLPKARVRTRVVLTPTNAKMLLRALQQNIERYESEHGEIMLPPRPQSLADQLFSTIRSDEDDTEGNGEEEGLTDE